MRQDLLDALFAREDRTVVERFVDAKFGEPHLRHERGAVGGEHEFLIIAPLITAGMGGMQVEGIAMEGLRRGVAALDDLETIAALKSSL